MFEQDLILRAIRQFAAALARVVAAKRQEKWEEAQGEINSSLEALTGMTALQLAQLPVNSVLTLLQEPGQGQLDGERAAAVARLLKEQGEVLQLSGVDGAKPHLIKAFCLLDELDEQALLPPEEQPTLQWLVKQLG